MQRYLSQGEAGEVRHEPPFSLKPLFWPPHAAPIALR